MSRLVFLDFETTGLDPTVHEPIEVAVVITDDRFRELERFGALIHPTAMPEKWDPEALAMHVRSGLAGECVKHGHGRALVGASLRIFLATHAERGPLHLAGNSVHFDRAFLKHFWPDVERMFHHRQLDVSSIRMLGERITRADQLGGEKPHRAMEDVRRSIAELKHWAHAIRYGTATLLPFR